ncbi:SCO2522 family protein [Streptomyces sp. NPDC047072]|uniref:SCO2522 family protein n=1 Tax=Streptomyces sp. NPDC047072 TaxID=3154809 RepID=UPI0033F2B9B6
MTGRRVPVFQEATDAPRTQAVPLAHVSLELGHLYAEDFEAGPGRLREHFARVRPFVDAVRSSAAVSAAGRKPRVSTCFLVDDYLRPLAPPSEVLPVLLDAAERAGVRVDYLARESACAVAGRIPLADHLVQQLVESPPPGSDGSRPPVGQTGWLSNGERSPAAPRQAMAPVPVWRPPAETAARRHSIFTDVQLWDEQDGKRTWSCAFLSAVWQLARLGLLRDRGETVLLPVGYDGAPFPRHWAELPALTRLEETAAPFSAYLTWSVLPSRFLAVEHAVRVVLDQVAADPAALRQVTERSAREELPVPESIAERVSYVFYPEP